MEKNWGNLGFSTGTVTNLQTALRHESLSAITSASGYPGTSSLVGHTTCPWQRVTHCGAANVSATSQSHLLSPQQHNQIQRQASQLRYFQVEKVNQYSAHNRYNSSHHYPRRYALVASSPLLALNSLNISDRSTFHQCESGAYSSINYNTNKFQSIDESAFRVPSLESIDESQNHRTDRSSNQQNFPPLRHTYRLRYNTLTRGNFLIPASSQVSLTTCFALSSSGTNPFVVEAAFATATSAPVDPVSSLPKLIPASVKSSLPPFVNAVVAVPDMMREIRPQCATILGRRTLTTIPVSQEEFSYNASKPRIAIRVETSIVAKIDSNRDKNWPELTLKTRRAVAAIFESTDDREISSKSEKSVWKKKSTIEAKNSNTTTRHREKLSKARNRTCGKSEKLKTYADAVQKTSSSTLHRNYNEEQPLNVDAGSWIMNLRENRRPSKMCPSFFHTSTPKIELRGVRKKREYQESCDDDNEHSSTSTASNGSYYGRSATPESFSSPEVANSTNWKETSSASSSSSSSSSLSSVRGIDDDNNGARYANNEHREKKVPSRKRLCKMAEMFCFGQLENAAFFRAFDEYNRRRRRMSYTQKLEDGPEVDTLSFRRAVEAAEVIRGEVALVSAISVGLQRELHDTNSMRYQNTDCGNDFSIMTPYRITEMEDPGAFKVLQKIKECADGNGAIYTNSWRPEELHFLRRCYQDKNI